MIDREKGAEERVIKVLKKSREALEETTNNHKELSRFNRELQAYASELKSHATDLATRSKDFNKRMDKADEDMKENNILVSGILRDIKVERKSIEMDRKLVEGERREVANSMKLLRDREGMLKRGFDELKNKQKIK
jgi:hypothetical protein